MLKILVLSITLFQPVHVTCLERNFVIAMAERSGESPILAGLDSQTSNSIMFEIWYDPVDQSWTMFNRMKKIWACNITIGFGLVSSNTIPRKKADDREQQQGL